MGFFDFFKKEEHSITAEQLFKSDKKQNIEVDYCENCKVKSTCMASYTGKPDYLCNFVQELPDYNPDKDSILLFDDNEGVVSFLYDDLVELNEDGQIVLANYNVLKFTGEFAAFSLLASLRPYKGLRIKIAVFDITIGGGVYNDGVGNIILDGVDAFIAVKEYNEDLIFSFFTGNKLNPYVHKNQEIIEKYKKATNNDIIDSVVYKTSLSFKDRQNLLKRMIQP